MPPDIPVKPLRRSIWERISVVWLIPVAAFLIALGVAWQSYSDRGPQIIITFDGASGVKAGETVLRYRDVNVGLVEKVSFSASLEKVDVTVRLDKDIAPYVDGDAQFWVVRPEVTTQGVTGLDTVLSGVFIEGYWNTTPGGLVVTHEGREDAPLLRVGETGTRITLRVVGDAVMSENTPIVYKGITVGRTGKPRLNRAGTEAVSEAVIYTPHDALIIDRDAVLGHVGLFVFHRGQRRRAGFFIACVADFGRNDVRDHRLGRAPDHRQLCL